MEASPVSLEGRVSALEREMVGMKATIRTAIAVMVFMGGGYWWCANKSVDKLARRARGLAAQPHPQRAGPGFRACQPRYSAPGPPSVPPCAAAASAMEAARLAMPGKWGWVWRRGSAGQDEHGLR